MDIQFRNGVKQPSKARNVSSSCSNEINEVHFDGGEDTESNS